MANQATTSLSPQEAVGVMVPLLTGGGAKVHNASSSAITGEVETKKGPSCLVTLILLLIMILPGILYMIWGGSKITESFSITLAETERGTVATASGQGRGLKAAEYAISKLPT